MSLSEDITTGIAAMTAPSVGESAALKTAPVMIVFKKGKTMNAAFLERLRNHSDGDVMYRIGHEYVDANDSNAVKIPRGEVTGAWYDLPLPGCPDCGCEVVWGEAGLVPGARECVGCGSRFSVETDRVPEPEPEVERFSFECDNGHRWDATEAEDHAAEHKCPTCGDYWV